MATRSAYPKQVKVDFRKLQMISLQNYAKHYSMEIRPEITREDLAIAVARHFELESKNFEPEQCEQGVLNHFLSAYDHAFGKALSYEHPPALKRPKASQQGFHNASLAHGQAPAAKHSRATAGAASFGPASEGDIVAAKVVEECEEAAQTGWILATVQRYNLERDEFEVVDEDDAGLKVYCLGRDRIARLQDGVGTLNKGEPVMAVFPETTSFYRGHISKPVKRPRDNGTTAIFDVTIQFEEDEGEDGKTPNRRVPSNHVMADPDDGGPPGADDYGDNWYNEHDENNEGH